MQTGRCECGGVQFEITGHIPDVVVCHCSQCRRTSGHIWAGVLIPDDQFTLTMADSLCWYRSSDTAQRGFCRTCGASLFFKMDNEAAISVASGVLDQPTGLKIGKHIFAADKADYYDITDRAPQLDRF